MNAKDNAGGSALTRETILAALRALSEQLVAQGLVGEICLFGGTAMILAFTARLTTKDVDALFQPAKIIRELAGRIGEDLGLPAKWLNDAVKDFVSERHERTQGNIATSATRTRSEFTWMRSSG
ncbi:MAG: hypothetical protein ABSD20_16410 [Terriglobales bacterium]|jgi:hypothetical protein